MNAGSTTFAATGKEQQAHSVQSLVRMLFQALTLLLLVPVLGILGLLIVEGAPALSWSPPRSTSASTRATTG
jgi:hypothetical protein